MMKQKTIEFSLSVPMKRYSKHNVYLDYKNTYSKLSIAT